MAGLIENMSAVNKKKIFNNVFIAICINDYNFTSQLQLYAAEHNAQRWLEELEKDEVRKIFY